MSFNIGLSGLRAVNQELSVISNNVANASTAGFKSSRAEFAAIYGGGQAGGVEMNNVSQNFDRNGDVTRTGRGLDLAISFWARCRASPASWALLLLRPSFSSFLTRFSSRNCRCELFITVILPVLQTALQLPETAHNAHQAEQFQSIFICQGRCFPLTRAAGEKLRQTTHPCRRMQHRRFAGQAQQKCGGFRTHLTCPDVTGRHVLVALRKNFIFAAKDLTQLPCQTKSGILQVFDIVLMGRHMPDAVITHRRVILQDNFRFWC